jgi:hypothetical protein
MAMAMVTGTATATATETGTAEVAEIGSGLTGDHKTMGSILWQSEY